MASISEQPADSRIIVTEQDGALSFNVPRQGLRRGGGGIYLFAMVWCSIVAVITVVFATAFFAGRANGGDVAAWIIFGVLAVFWLIGAGFMLAAVNMARRRAGIVVADGRLSVLKSGLFGSKTRAWTRDELSFVRAGPSGITINNRPVLELQILPRQDPKFSMLVGNDEAELHWLAGRITTALGLDEQEMLAGHPMGDVDRPPQNTRVAVETSANGLAISVPAAGLRRGSLGIFYVGLAWSFWMVVFFATLTYFDQLKQAPLPVWFMFAVLEAIGLGALLLGIYLGTRRAEIGVAAGQLLVLHRSIFGTRRGEWAREDLASIAAVVSDASINNKPLMQLRIVPCESPAFAMFTGRDDLELAWIATLLRRQLDLPADAEILKPKMNADERR